MPVTFKTSEQVLQLVAGRQIVDAPSGYRKVTTASRLVQTEDGPIPLLWLIAEAKFGHWDPRTHIAYWNDRDPGNESFENVEITPKSLARVAKKSKYGAVAGTPEYYRRYHQANPDKRRTYQRERYKKMREALNAQREAVEGKGLPGAPSEDKFAAALKALEAPVPVDVTEGDTSTNKFNDVTEGNPAAHQAEATTIELSSSEQPSSPASHSILSDVSLALDKSSKL